MRLSLSDKLLIADMIEACEALLSYTQGLSRNTILAHKEKLHAIYFNFQVIGEAANKLSEAFKAKDESIPWRKITALRHRIVHDYAGIDDILIMELLENEIPSLLNKFSNLQRIG